MFGTKYRSDVVVDGEMIREYFNTFLDMLRVRRRPFVFIYFHSLMNAFALGPISRIRNIINSWEASEQALLV